LFSIFFTVADNELGRIQLCKYRSEQFCKTRLEESGWNPKYPSKNISVFATSFSTFEKQKLES
jgi:hypothetical protein